MFLLFRILFGRFLNFASELFFAHFYIMKLHGYLLTRAEAVLEDRDPRSLTQPEQVRPLDQILRQRMAGIPVPDNGGAYSESDYPDFEFMDPLQILEYRDELSDKMEGLKQEFDVATRKLAKKQAEKPENQAVVTAEIEDPEDPKP